MKVTVDTNILVRAVADDDEVQSPLARQILVEASAVILPLLVLAEFDWVMRKFYRFSRPSMHDAIERLLAAPNTVVDREAVAAGLAFLAGGGDFADGIIAFDGRRLGGDVFASFDEKAKRIVAAAGFAVI